MSQPAQKHAEPAAPDVVFEPFIPASNSQLPELTARGLLIGSLLGIVFAASSVYLGLKVGLTVSASIPVAVLSITLFRWLAKALKQRPSNILENNIVQTTGSAGESIAAGVAFTLPSLLLMGHDLELLRVMLVALLGGLIGVLMMIPLRHGLIVKEHGKLAYPEGTACADVLIVGEQGGTNAKTVFLGFFVGLGYAFLNSIARLWAEAWSFMAELGGRLKGASMSFDVSPPMLGVGYIIGPRVAANMMAGGTLSFMILVPLVHLFGDGLTAPMYPEQLKLISAMSGEDIHKRYLLYIGAGAVATGGFLALARALPTIVAAFGSGLKSLKLGRTGGAQLEVKRTDRDLPMSIVLGGTLAIGLVIWLAPILEINPVAAVLILLFGFFFVTVSSRITGEIGSSSNPISGMTVATLLLTCGLFVAIGWTGTAYKAMALTTAALVCVAASNGGTISQDLKTGFLVGATPKAQQISILVGVMSSAIVIGFVLLLLNTSYTTFQAVTAPGFTAPIAADAQQLKGPDGKMYKVAYVADEVDNVERGKYLVDDAGQIQYLVDPGVSGTYPYKLQPASASTTLSVPADAPVELGIDHQAYKIVETESAQGDLPAGRYLVTDSGEVKYSATKESKFNAPKAQLFRLIIDGTLGGKLPWGLVIIGALLAIMMELVGVSALPFAVGLYLPMATSAGIFVGGIVRWLVDRKRRGESAAAAEFSPGMLFASGLIAGGSIAGVILGVIKYTEKDAAFDWSGLLGGLAHNESLWPAIPFVILAASVYWVGVRGQSGGHSDSKKA